MKELKILAVVVFFTLATYLLVETYAHSVMHPTVDSKKFVYSDLDEATKGVMSKKGNAANGKSLVSDAGCTGCHSINVEKISAPMDALTAAASYGVNPPDLSNSGVVYDAKFLADLIKNPAHALKVEHKFTPESGKMHPMVPFYGMGGDIDQEIADMVAYLQSIAVSQDDLTPEMAFEDACSRCHTMDYLKWTQLGSIPKFKGEIESLTYKLQVLEYQDSLKAYMGKLPPDLSMQVLARGETRTRNFIEDPQSYLDGTAMPRVGVTAESAEKVITFMLDSADAKREQREEVGKYVVGFMVLLAILAFLWKQQIWRDLK